MSTESPPTSRAGRTLAYFGWLTLFVYLASPTGYLVDIQTSYLLKDQLHASATQVSIFRVLTAVPVYLAFLFGMVRDRWNPLGLRDRGFFLIFAPLTAAVFLWMALARTSYAALLVGMLLAMVASRFAMAAYQGLMALIGQEQLMSGRLSVVWNVVSSIPVMAGAFASGYVSDHFSPRVAFGLVAVACLLVAAQGLWKPAAVFGRAYQEPKAQATTSLRESVRRLLRHRAIYPAVLVNLLWSFAPGSNTALQFYLADHLHASEAVYSYYNGVFVAAFVPTFLLYGWMCKHVSLDKLLWWGTLVAIPQMIPLAFIHSGTLAVVLAAPIGLLGGVATAAYYDLAMRSCPPGLQGTLMMLVDAGMVLAMRGGDLLGSAIYNSSPAHGFTWCVVATTAVYALILPILWLVPKGVADTADGQAVLPAGEGSPDGARA
ncbi:MAG TPA: MFS transporter [Anaeromyxobacter sp.]|nr:MFS transporter [Anaeromyxobacter sp.]